ncbi:MAG: hypothetical protein KJ749_09980 [Planctomycetes bacterium]|nr:hypothetical protein [Planctomycetota bacterium]
MLDVMERPECSPLLLSLLERCAHMLFQVSRGEAPNADAVGNAARQAARVLDQFGIDADWIHLTDPRESMLPEDLDAVSTEGMYA